MSETELARWLYEDPEDLEDGTMPPWDELEALPRLTYIRLAQRILKTFNIEVKHA